MNTDGHYRMKDLKDPQKVEEYLSLMLLADDTSGFIFALYNVVLAQDGFAKLAEQTGITKEGLYKSLRPDSDPRFRTIRKIVCALGYDFKLVKNIFKDNDKKYKLRLYTLAETDPDLVKQWHHSKNKTLTPGDVRAESKREVWWQCPAVDEHEWKEAISIRLKEHRCPYCLGLDPKTYNSLATTCPDIAKQWHPTKNKGLTASDVPPRSNKKVWWKCFSANDHEWIATIANRTKGHGCPFCRGFKVSKSNCLATTHGALALEWSHDKNGSLTPRDVTAGSNKKAWWQCCKADLHHQWQAVVASRVTGSGCPYCSNKKVSKDNCLAAKYPEIVSQWHVSKNRPMTPKDVTAGSNKKVWWKCASSVDHEWQAAIVKRTHGRGCPMCAKKENAKRLVNMFENKVNKDNL